MNDIQSRLAQARAEAVRQQAAAIAEQALRAEEAAAMSENPDRYFAQYYFSDDMILRSISANGVFGAGLPITSFGPYMEARVKALRVQGFEVTVEDSHTPGPSGGLIQIKQLAVR